MSFAQGNNDIFKFNRVYSWFVTVYSCTWQFLLCGIKPIVTFLVINDVTHVYNLSFRINNLLNKDLTN